MGKLWKLVEEYGGDIEGIKDRFVGDEAFYESCLNMFFEDKSLKSLKETLEANNLEESFALAHSVKGVVGNLGLTPLYNITSELVELLRSKDIEGAKVQYKVIMKEYEKFEEYVK